MARPTDSSARPRPARRKKALVCWTYRRTPHARAARCRLPPPSSRSFRSPGAAWAISDGLLGSAVSSSITTSALDPRRASSSPPASNALTLATAAPRSARALAPASDRVMPVTVCPRRTSSAMSGRPIAPLAPATKTFMVMLQFWWGVLLPRRRDRHFLGVAGVQDHRQEAGPGLATRVPGHPVHRPRRFVERFPGPIGLDRLFDGVLV